jgi:hypothetical protein
MKNTLHIIFLKSWVNLNEGSLYTPAQDIRKLCMGIS